MVAAGDYDGYVAEPRAYEWDIAAGHAILEHSGGTVTDFDGNEILYGKKDLKNPSLILKSRNIINGWAIKNYINNNCICFYFLRLN